MLCWYLEGHIVCFSWAVTTKANQLTISLPLKPGSRFIVK
jgi:hypothetical protein